MNKPNPRCAKCNMCACVTEYPTGVSMTEDEQYFQCLSGMEYECLPEGEHINEHVELYTDDTVEASPWVQFLSEKGICHEDAVGNMPCDNGCICDKCHADWIQAEYEAWKVEKGICEEVCVNE